MALKSEPYFWVECDRCHCRADYDQFSAMIDASQAVEGAEDSGWLTVRDATGREHHFCTGCTAWSEDEDRLVPISPISGKDNHV